jgi:folate-binding protein YgfZ
MDKKIIILKDRALLEISGLQRYSFLQSLITNDINKLKTEPLIYCALLNPQGRFLYDFFIFEIKDKIFLDCYKIRVEEIIKKLNFYKLKSDVQIKLSVEFKVAQIINSKISQIELPQAHIFIDPRNFNMGFRVFFNHELDLNYLIEKYQLVIATQDSYNLKRIELKIPEGEYDLTYEKSFILEYDFNSLNAIDYKKGCYLGQEVTARTHWRGQIRKKLVNISIESLSEIAKGTAIYMNEEEVGIVLSSVFFENKLQALALIKIFDQESQPAYIADKLEIMGNKISINN